MPGGVGSLRLQGRLVDGVRWSLGGLVAENEGRAWRTAAEFVLEPGGGHEVEVGAGYGAGDVRTTLAGAVPEPNRAVGAAFVRDRWQLGERLTATTGARYTYIGFLPDSHHADAVVQIELRGDRQTLVRGSVSHAHPDPGRRPADAVDGGGLAGHHLGAARRGPAPGALAALRGGRRPRARRRPHRGAGLHRDDARPAAHDLRRPHAVRPQRRKPRGTGLRRDRGPPVRRRRERLGHLHVRPGPPLRGPRASRTWP